VTAAELSAVDSLSGRLAVAHDALAGLLQWFGLAEPTQITREGALVPRAWGMGREQIERWASEHGVACQ
jgi:hypothetical protein